MAEVLTGAIALIKVGNTYVGKMKDVRASENMRRARVSGLGTILPKELPVTEWSGTLNCSFYLIDLKTSGLPGAILRDVQTVQEFEDTLVLNEVGLTVEIFKKVSDVILPNGAIRPKLTPVGVISGLQIESESFNVAEGQVSGRDQSFQYMNPIIRPA
jgi:hypothetical protein